MQNSIVVRPGEVKDADHLARLINCAGEGLPLYFWDQSKAAGQSAMAYGASRAARPSGGFSYRNARAAMVGAEVAGCLISYIIEAPAKDSADLPPIFVPLQELEDLAVGSRYINALAVYPKFRGRGIGTRLADIDGAERDQTLIVSDGNRNAIRLYERLGFRHEASRPMIKEGWTGAGAASAWLLMRRKAADAVAECKAKPDARFRTAR